MGYNERWGYKGTETSINGLTKIILDHIDFRGTDMQRHQEACELIIRYAKEKIPNFKKRGHLEVAASFVAKKIQQNDKYTDFKNWLLALPASSKK